MNSRFETCLTSVSEDENLLLEVDFIVLENTVPVFPVDSLDFGPTDPGPPDESQGDPCRGKIKII